MSGFAAVHSASCIVLRVRSIGEVADAMYGCIVHRASCFVSGAKRLGKGKQHAGNVIHERTWDGISGDVFPSQGNLKLRIDLVQTTACLGEEVREVLMRVATKALRNVRRNGDDGTAQLIAKSIALFSREQFDDLVDCIHKIHALLPNVKFAKRFHQRYSFRLVVYQI